MHGISPHTGLAEDKGSNGNRSRIGQLGNLASEQHFSWNPKDEKEVRSPVKLGLREKGGPHRHIKRSKKAGFWYVEGKGGVVQGEASKIVKAKERSLRWKVIGGFEQ